jgi:hypothetical protein
MKAVGYLAGSIGELVTESAVGGGDAGVDRGAGRARILSGLKSDVIQQHGFAKITFRNVTGTVDTRPPADKMEQVVSIEPQALVRQPAYVLTIQVTIDPADFVAGFLLDNANWTLGSAGGFLIPESGVKIAILGLDRFQSVNLAQYVISQIL